jgi:hypothetical protein
MDNFEDSVFPETRTLSNLPLNIPGMAIRSNNDPSMASVDASIGGSPFPIGQTHVTDVGVPLGSVIKEPVEKPGWFEQVGHELWKMNRLTQAGEFALNLFDKNPATDEVPEGWSAMSPESVEGFPEQYFDYLTDAKSPNDLLARQQKVREQMHDDERFADGSLTAELVGGFAGIVTDPTNYLIPMACGLKYAGIAQNIFLNMGRSSGGIAIDAVSRNMLIQANRAGGNLQELATDSFRDFVFGTALVGAGAAVSGGLREAQLWNLRKAVNFGADGVNIDPVVKEVNGQHVIVGYKGTAAPNMGTSAEVVNAANQFIDDSMKMSGAFGLPFIGEPVKKMLAWGPLASPVLKAAASPYPAVRNFFNRLAPHGIITEGESKGLARPDAAQDFAEMYNDQARTLSKFIRGKYYEANGIKGGVTTGNSLRNFKQRFDGSKTISEEDFGKEVRRIAYEEDYKSDYSQAHEVANAALDFLDYIGKEYHASVGKEGEFLSPRTAWKYLPQNYNIPAMINEPEKWMSITAGALQEQDKIIQDLHLPIEQAKLHLAQLKESMSHPEFVETRALVNEIAQANATVKLERDKLIKKLRDNPDLHILLEDRVLLDSKDDKQLTDLLKPLKEFESNYNSATRDLDELNKKLSSVNSSLSKNLKSSTRENNLKIKKYTEEAIEGQQKKIQELKNELDNERVRLNEMAYNHEIDSRFYTKEGHEIKFRTPGELPKIRKPFDSHYEREEYAKQAYESIMNQSPEDLVNGVLGSLEPGIIEQPSYLKARTLLIDSQVYNGAGFLDADIGKSLSAYAASMGRIIGFKKAFPEFAESKGLEGVLRAFKQDFDTRKSVITQKKRTPARDKELQNMEKEYKEAVSFMSDTYKVYMGSYDKTNPEYRAISTSLKNMVVSAKLGAVPLYQISELGAIVMKSGLMPFLAQGLKPMLKSLTGQLKGAEAEAFKENAAHAWLGLYNTRNAYSDRLVNPSNMSSPPATTAAQKVGVATDNLAHVSGNLFGTNFIANMNERIAANIWQSEVMSYMFKHSKGVLKDSERRKLARYGIDPAKWSERFIKGYKESGGWEKSGGYQSQYYKWQDAEAANRMALSMRRMVHDTIVNKNIFSSPYWANNPFMSMIFLFHGWAYSAFNHYAVPMLQRPDAEHILGVVGLVGLSLLTEPMLRLANGKEAYEDDTSWFDEAYKAVDYAGVLGPYPQYLQDINNAFGGALIPHLQSEKYKNRPQNIVGGGGPVAGYLSDAVGTAGHLWKGNFTENDAKKAERLLPFSSHIAVRGLINKYIESLQLPTSRKSANSWMWWDKIYSSQ